MDIAGDTESPPYQWVTQYFDTIGGRRLLLSIHALHQKISQYIDVSMLESVLTTMGWVVSNLLMNHVEPTRVGNENMTSPSGTFKTQDGLINIAASKIGNGRNDHGSPDFQGLEEESTVPIT